MQDFVFKFERNLYNIVQNHANHDLDTGGNYSTSIDVNKKIFDKFLNLLRNGSFGFKFDVTLFSYRNRRGIMTSALRTVYSKPMAIADIFNEKEDLASFDFTKDAYDDKSNFFSQPFPENYENIKDSKSEIVWDFYRVKNTSGKSKKFSGRISGFFDKIEGHSQKNQIIGPGSDRITKKLFDELRSGNCFVVSRIKDSSDNGDSKINDLLALYSTDTQPDYDHFTKEKKADLFQCLAMLFSAIESVERRDRSNFRKEALKAINESVVDFADRKIPPAYNMRIILEKLQKLSCLHPSMGCGSKIDDVRVRFVRTEFLLQGDKVLPRQTLFPPALSGELKSSFLFSHVKSKTVVKHLLGEWCHRNNWTIDIPNKDGEPISKQISEEFKSAHFLRLDTNGKLVKIPPRSFGKWIPHNNGKKVLGIYASNQVKFVKKGNGNFLDSQYWNERNHSKEIETTAAFLVFLEESTNEVTALPFGIFAFESSIQDAFSKEDNDVFFDIAMAMGNLLAVSGTGNSFIDYSSKLRQAIVNDEFADEPEIGKITYELQRLDWKELRSFVEFENGDDGYKSTKAIINFLENADPKNSITKELFNDFFQCLFKDTKFPSETIKPPTLNEYGDAPSGNLSEWIRDHLDFTKTKWHENYQIITEFLEAIPSNPNWHSRLSTIPRVLSDRQLEKPSLTRFPTGFSADAIYILNHNREISQVLKFSGQEDIETEILAYKKFVRFNIPLAARIPSTGFAVETNGINKSGGYGALLSDLVTGISDGPERSPHSLTDRIKEAICLQLGDSPKSEIHAKSTIDAVKHHFWLNTSRWRNPCGSPTFEDEANKVRDHFKTKTALIHNSSRIKTADKLEYEGPSVTYKKKNSHGKLELHSISKKDQKNILNSIGVLDKIICNSIDKLIEKDKIAHQNAGNLDIKCPSMKQSTVKFDSLSELVEFWEAELEWSSDDEGIPPEILSVIHGDLNPQNLTWSEDYQKFQLIDFEHVRFGFRGSDQLKLIFAMFLDLHQKTISDKIEEEEAQLHLISQEIETGLYVVFCLARYIDHTAELKITGKGSNFNNYLDKKNLPSISGCPSYFGRLIKEIIKTILCENDEGAEGYLDNKGVFRNFEGTNLSLRILKKTLGLGLRCFSLKELYYALSSMDSNDYKLLETIITSIKKDESWVDNNACEIKCVRGLLLELGKEEKGVNYSKYKNVSAFVNSYLAYAAVCAGLGKRGE